MIEARGVTGVIRFDGQTVTIVRERFADRWVMGSSEKTIPLAQIAGVQFKRAKMLQAGFIQFTVPGGVERRSSFGNQVKEATTDENSVVFAPKHSADFERLRDAINAALAGHQQSAQAPVPTPPPAGPSWTPANPPAPAYPVTPGHPVATPYPAGQAPVPAGSWATPQHFAGWGR